MDRAGDVRTPFTRLFPPKLQVCKDSSTALARVVFRGRFAADSLNRRGILARSQILSLWSRRVNTRVCPTLATIQLELQAGNHTSVSLLVVQRCPARQLFTPSLTGPQWQSPSASDQPVELRPVNLFRDTVTFSSAITLTSLQALSSDLSPQPFSYENVPCYVKRQA